MLRWTCNSQLRYFFYIIYIYINVNLNPAASPVGRRWWLVVLDQLRSGSAAADSFLCDLAELIHSSNSGSAYTALTYRVGSLPAVGAVLNELFLALWMAH